MGDKLLEVVKEIIEQPLEGLLYDLDLLPEQCRDGWKDLVRTVVEELYKRKEAGDGAYREV